MEIGKSSGKLNLQRQGFLGANSEHALRQTKVAIVGLGGGGSHIAQQLGHVGVGQFVLLDPDRIEDTNLNRLVGGSLDDTEHKLEKVLIAKRVIQSVNRYANVIAKPTPWQEQTSLLQGCDVVFGCIDSLIGRSELEAFARRCMIPLIDIGMDVHSVEGGFIISGQVALSMPDMPCLRCTGLLPDLEMTKEAERYGGAGARPQVIWPNAVLASTAVGLLMQLVTPWHKTNEISLLLEYDGNKQTVTPSSKLPYLRPQCSHFSDIGNLGDSFWSPEVGPLIKTDATGPGKGAASR